MDQVASSRFVQYPQQTRNNSAKEQVNLSLSSTTISSLRPPTGTKKENLLLGSPHHEDSGPITIRRSLRDSTRKQQLF